MRVVLICFSFLFFSNYGQTQIRAAIGSQYIVDNLVLGVQGRVMYQTEDNWRGSGTFTYHFDRTYDWSLDLDGQYKIATLGSDTNISPLLGLALQTGPVGGLDIGANAGIFMDFKLSDLSLYLEPKFIFKKASTIAFSAGLLF